MATEIDLTVVFTGKITNLTYEHISGVRSQYPEARIIVATYDTQCMDLATDFSITFLLLKDPGPNCKLPWGKFDNLGRQVYLNISALNIVNTKYVLKLRTDMGLKKPLPISKIRDGVILIPESFTRNPARFPLLFHPSDLSQFGATYDVNQFWTSSKCEIGKTPPSFTKYPRWTNMGRYAQILTPEQRLCIQYMKSKCPENIVKLQYASQINRDLLEQSDNFLTTAFELLPDDIYDFPARFTKVRPGLNTNFNVSSWNKVKSKSNNPRFKYKRFIIAWISSSIISNFRLWNLKSKIRYTLFK